MPLCQTSDDTVRHTRFPTGPTLGMVKVGQRMQNENVWFQDSCTCSNTSAGVLYGVRLKSVHLVW